MTLDEIGILQATDKSSLVHDYLVHYDRLLSSMRNRNFNLVEIGVHQGASLRTWAEYFHNATVIGIDISPAAAQYASEPRIKVEIGSQADAHFLTTLANKYRPLVIIDDGSHHADHQIISFETLFPYLLPGGCYIVEDLGKPIGSQESIYRGSSSLWAAEYFSHLQKALMFRCLEPDAPSTHNQIFPFVSRCETIHGAIAIWRTEPPKPKIDIDHIEEITRKSDNPDALCYFADYLHYTIGDIDRALRIAQEAAALKPRDAWAHLRLSAIFERKGLHDEAILAATKAAELDPSPLFKERLRSIRANA